MVFRRMPQINNRKQDQYPDRDIHSRTPTFQNQTDEYLCFGCSGMREILEFLAGVTGLRKSGNYKSCSRSGSARSDSRFGPHIALNLTLSEQQSRSDRHWLLRIAHWVEKQLRTLRTPGLVFSYPIFSFSMPLWQDPLCTVKDC